MTKKAKRLQIWATTELDWIIRDLLTEPLTEVEVLIKVSRAMMLIGYLRGFKK